MKTIGIAIDTWKLEIFTKHIAAAGYRFKKTELSPGTLLLRIKADTADEIQPIVEAAMMECAGYGTTKN